MALTGAEFQARVGAEVAIVLDGVQGDAPLALIVLASRLVAAEDQLNVLSTHIGLAEAAEVLREDHKRTAQES